MTSVELSVANAHHQIQRVEDEVVKPLSEKVTAMYHDFFMFGGAMESWLEGMCINTKEALVKVLESYWILDIRIKNNTEQIIRLDNNQGWLESWEKGMNELVGEVWSLQDIVKDQSSTISLLWDHVRELELGHRLLHNRIIAIKVGGQRHHSTCTGGKGPWELLKTS